MSFRNAGMNCCRRPKIMKISSLNTSLNNSNGRSTVACFQGCRLKSTSWPGKTKSFKKTRGIKVVTARTQVMLPALHWRQRMFRQVKTSPRSKCSYSQAKMIWSSSCPRNLTSLRKLLSSNWCRWSRSKIKVKTQSYTRWLNKKISKSHLSKRKSLRFKICKEKSRFPTKANN